MTLAQHDVETKPHKTKKHLADRQQEQYEVQDLLANWCPALT